MKLFGCWGQETPNAALLPVQSANRVTMYYLDNAATTRPYSQVVEQVRQCLTEDFGNPSSIHPPGIRAGKTVEESRKILATIFRVPQAGVIFCSSGSESDNMAIKGVMGIDGKVRGKFITSQVEHAAVLNTADWLEQIGIEVDYAKIDRKTGQVDIEHLEELIDSDTRLVSIQHVNSETGIIQDLSTISKTIRTKNPGTLFHSDGVQAFGKIPLNLKKLGVDLYSISAHKFHGIKGAASLVLAKKIPLQILLHGGGQELGRRSGTENVPAIAAMGLAARLSYQEMENNYQKVERFASGFKKNLVKRIPEVRLLDPPDSIPHIISLSIPDLPGEVLLHHLAEKGIFVSTGSACSAATRKSSLVLRTLKFSPERIRETIRLSLSAEELPPDPSSFMDSFVGAVRELSRTI